MSKGTPQLAPSIKVSVKGRKINSESYFQREDKTIIREGTPELALHLKLQRNPLKLKTKQNNTESYFESKERENIGRDGGKP